MRQENTDIKNSDNENGKIIIYQSGDGHTKIDGKMQDETLWLTQTQMAELFNTTKQNISLHINNIFEEEELSQSEVVKEYLTTASDGKNYRTKHYNLDMIISLGHLKDNIEHLDTILTSTGENVLAGPGKVSHQLQTLSPVEESYLETIKSTEKKAKKLANKTGKAVKK